MTKTVEQLAEEFVNEKDYNKKNSIHEQGK